MVKPLMSHNKNLCFCAQIFYSLSTCPSVKYLPIRIMLEKIPSSTQWGWTRGNSAYRPSYSVLVGRILKSRLEWFQLQVCVIFVRTTRVLGIQPTQSIDHNPKNRPFWTKISCTKEANVVACGSEWSTELLLSSLAVFHHPLTTKRVTTLLLEGGYWQFPSDGRAG